MAEQALGSQLEGRAILRNVGRETCERLLGEDPDRKAPRFFYRG